MAKQDRSVRFSSHWSDQKHAKLLLEFLENIRKECINQIMLRKCLCWDKCSKAPFRRLLEGISKGNPVEMIRLSIGSVKKFRLRNCHHVDMKIILGSL